VRRAYLDRPGGQVHYADEGEGPPLVLLHHTPRSIDYHAPLFPLLKDRFRLIAIDSPGFGRSDPLASHLTIPLIAEFIIDVVDRLGLGRFYLYGTHTGAAAAIAVAGMIPDRVARLALLAAPVITSDDVRQEALATLQNERPVSPDGSELVRFWHAYGMNIWRAEVARGHDIPVEAAQDFASGYLRDILRCQARAREGAHASFTFDGLSALKKIKSPTLVLQMEGETDPTVRLRPFLRSTAALREHISDLQVDTLPAAHATFANVSVPNEVAASLARFFGQGPL
jgi:pimeloyl-ACP methyl ester carboxylesterase